MFGLGSSWALPFETGAPNPPKHTIAEINGAKIFVFIGVLCRFTAR
jgi:hypothetical protein